MFIKYFLILLSWVFNLIKYIKSEILNWGKGFTFPGYILEFTKIDFLKIYFQKVDSTYIFVTGTNGKTSTCSLLKHLLVSQGFSVVSNHTGSNLRRGVLSTLILEFSEILKVKPDYLVLELDEASVPSVLKSFPKHKSFYLMVLNLSRDQLDRYGEIDNLVVGINNVLTEFPHCNLILGEDLYTEKFRKPYSLLKKHRHKKELIKSLGIKEYTHLNQNLDFILTLFELLHIPISSDSVGVFNLVEGRGTTYKINNTSFEIHLTKNPVSFNNNLKFLQKRTVSNVLIYVNDNIPDGRDVSWFYDIDYSLLKTVLGNKSVFLCGSRSYDFYNFLNILNIPSFNMLNMSKVMKYCKLWNLPSLFVFSNYSATQEVLNRFKQMEYR